MTPEELTAALRRRVRQDITRRLKFALEASEGHTASLSELLVAYEITTAEHADRVASLVRELVRDEALNQHMTTALIGYKAHPELEATFLRLAADPASVGEDELHRAIDAILNDDRLVSAPIKIMMANQKIRDILGVPPELTFERYIGRLREALASARNYDEFARAATDALGGPLVPALTAVATVVAVGVAVLATAALAVHTVALALNYAAVYAVAVKAAVFTVAGDLSTVAGGVLPLQIGRVSSECVNECDDVVWVIVSDGVRIRRVPLAPSQSSQEVGLTAVWGLLVGGPSNPVERLRTPSGKVQEEGVYWFAQRESQPARIVVRTTDGCHVVDVNKVQLEAAQSEFPDSDPVVCGRSEPIRTDTVAAAVPAGFDYASTMHAALSAQRHFRTMQFVDALRKTDWSRL